MIITLQTVDGRKDIQIQPGDAFASRSDKWYSKCIRFFSAIWSRDGVADYSHTGLLLAGDMTFEALYSGITICGAEKYRGEQVIIVRFDSVSGPKREAILKEVVARFAGRKYPFWRLAMHMLGPVAKICWLKIPVCSELIAFYEYRLGIRHSKWAGTSPDTLVDEWRQWRGVTVLGEGRVD